MTRPRKKYRPKIKRAPALLMRLAPAKTESDFEKLDLPPRVALRAIEAGTPQLENFIHLNVCMKEAYVIAAAFDQKWEVRLAILMAYVTINEAQQDFLNGRETQDDLSPVHDALDLLSDMERGVTREEFVKVANTVEDNMRTIMPYSRNDVWRMGPHHSTWPVGEHIICYHQGAVRFGRLERKDQPYAPILRTQHGSFLLHEYTLALVVHFEEGEEIPCI